MECLGEPKRPAQLSAVTSGWSPMASDTPPRIFVGIPSYRDPGAFQYVLDGHKLFYAGLSGSPSISDGITECQYTVKDLFEKAQCPDRVFVGICWQFDPEEDKEVESHHHYAIMHDNSNLILVLLGANETEPGPRGTSSLHRSEVRSFSLSRVCASLSLSFLFLSVLVSPLSVSRNIVAIFTTVLDPRQRAVLGARTSASTLAGRRVRSFH